MGTDNTNPPPSKKAPKILIIDCHSGLALCTYSMLKELGADAEAFGDIVIYGCPSQSVFPKRFLRHDYPPRPSRIGRLLSLFRFIIQNPATAVRHTRDYYRAGLRSDGIKWRECVRPSPLRCIISGFTGRGVNRSAIQKLLRLPCYRSYFSQFDTLVCCFPPITFQFAKLISEMYGQRIILTMGHRFNIRIPRNKDYNERLKEELLELMRDDKHAVGAMTHYDRLYAQHYLSKIDKQLMPEAIPVFGVEAFHIKLSPKAKPACNTILITPVHVVGDGRLPLDVSHINRDYEAFCEKNGLQTDYVFKTIRQHWNFKPYSYDDLSSFAGIAIVNFPYSSFSTSQVETYGCCLPYFYPDEEFFVRHDYDNDYRLHPIYMSEAEYRRVEEDIDSLDSPNSLLPEARRKWVRHGYNRHTQNAVAFSDWDDLFQKIHEALPRYAEISRAIYEENVARRKKHLELWRRLLNMP